MTKEIEAAKVISEIYFEIAAEAIGEEKVRELRDKKLKQRSEAGQHETIVMRALKKYVQYINDVEGTDYITIHDQRPFSDVDFTSEEWGLLKEISKQNA